MRPASGRRMFLRRSRLIIGFRLFSVLWFVFYVSSTTFPISILNFTIYAQRHNRVTCRNMAILVFHTLWPQKEVLIKPICKNIVSVSTSSLYWNVWSVDFKLFGHTSILWVYFQGHYSFNEICIAWHINWDISWIC